MSKHTPGPWEWSENLLVSQTPPHDVVLREHVVFRPNDADALLIAAAPDLLAACEEFLSGSARAPLLARFALAKAKGEKP